MGRADRGSILAVDDEPQVLDLIINSLESEYRISAATNGPEALAGLGLNGTGAAHTRIEPDLILLDIDMPGMDGYEVCRRLKAHPETRSIPVIFLSGKKTSREDEARGLLMGGADFIAKPTTLNVLRARVKSHVTLKKLLDRRTESIYEAQKEIVYSLAAAAEFKDYETGSHIKRLSLYSRELARLAGMEAERVETIALASPMHDVGKIGIPDHILLKPGKLDQGEWEIMQSHTLIGEKILSASTSVLLETAKTIAVSHHERYDGQGYPHGLAGEAIPIEGRITAVCDVFDALTSERPYKRAWTDTEALEELERARGTHLDAELVDHFVKNFEVFVRIRRRNED
ncbi:MAG: HD domain-containing phosphohydrolase [Spirochaetia bacterium]